MAKLRNSRYEYIKQIAAKTLKECEIKTIPIDPFKICEKRGYRLIKYSEKYSNENQRKLIEFQPNGFSYYQNGERIIEYNDKLPKERIRTTLFHEIGHIELRHSCPCTLAETEAEWFGAYIIAPPPVVNILKPDDCVELADEFCTSIQCGYYSMNRYQLWKRYSLILKNYEKDLIRQFTKSDKED